MSQSQPQKPTWKQVWASRIPVVTLFPLAFLVFFGILVPLELAVALILFTWRRIGWLIRCFFMWGRVFWLCWRGEFIRAKAEAVVFSVTERVRARF